MKLGLKAIFTSQPNSHGGFLPFPRFNFFNLMILLSGFWMAASYKSIKHFDGNPISQVHYTTWLWDSM